MSFARLHGDIIPFETESLSSTLVLLAAGHHGKYSLGSTIIIFSWKSSAIIYSLGIGLLEQCLSQNYESLSSESQYPCGKATVHL